MCGGTMWERIWFGLPQEDAQDWKDGDGKSRGIQFTWKIAIKIGVCLCNGLDMEKGR